MFGNYDASLGSLKCMNQLQVRDARWFYLRKLRKSLQTLSLKPHDVQIDGHKSSYINQPPQPAGPWRLDVNAGLQCHTEDEPDIHKGMKPEGLKQNFKPLSDYCDNPYAL